MAKEKVITRTFKELQEIDNMVAELYQKDDTLRQTKFGYAYGRFYDKNYRPVLKKYQEKIEDARVDNALIDEKTGEILNDRTNVRGFKYSKEGLKKCMKDEKIIIEESDAEAITIEPYICKEMPKTLKLTSEQKEAFTGLFI